MSSHSKTVKGQSPVSNGEQVEIGISEEDQLEELEKKDSLSVTSQLCIKPIRNSEKLDKEVVLRRIRHRKRMNKVRSAVGAFLFSSSTADASAQGKKWVDDAFAALNIKLLDAIEEAPEALARANSVLQDWISAQNTRPRGQTRFGCCLRDYQGNFRQIFTGWVDSFMEVQEGEAYAILSALRWMEDKPYQAVISSQAAKVWWINWLIAELTSPNVVSC
ncbi:hypothetical protein GmHk_04G009387 [Glycine max]|nr:hypothetical protein GmHk_04G009387 [Glycine max]